MNFFKEYFKDEQLNEIKKREYGLPYIVIGHLLRHNETTLWKY